MHYSFVLLQSFYLFVSYNSLQNETNVNFIFSYPVVTQQITHELQLKNNTPNACEMLFHARTRKISATSLPEPQWRNCPYRSSFAYPKGIFNQANKGPSFVAPLNRRANALCPQREPGHSIRTGLGRRIPRHPPRRFNGEEYKNRMNFARYH